MNIYPIDLNTKLVAVCYNSEKLNLFRVRVNVTLVDLKDQLDQIICRLNHIHMKGGRCRLSTSIDRLCREISVQPDDAQE